MGTLNEGIDRGRLLAESVLIARSLVNEPANVVNPVKMAERAQEVVNGTELSIDVLGREDMLEHGMGAMLAVIADAARQNGAKHLAGWFVPTKKPDKP